MGVADFTLTSVTGTYGTHDQVGAWVCQAGFVTAGAPGNCGPILSTAFDCSNHTNVRSVDYTRDDGDSGGTVYGFVYLSHSVPLTGFHAGTCNGSPFYSFVQWVEAILPISGWYLN